MIDLDVLEYCDRCKYPIAYIETVQKTGRYKNCTVTANAAEQAGVAAYLIEYEPDLALPGAIYTIKRAWITRLRPLPKQKLGEFTERRLKAWFVALHRRHQCPIRLVSDAS